MIMKILAISFTSLALILSFPAMSKQPQGKGNLFGNSSDSRNNSNRQSDEYSRRGRERAEERHELKKYKEHKYKIKQKKQKYRDEYHNRRGDYDDRDRYEHRRYSDDDENDRYRRQYEEERYGLDRRDERRYQEYKRQRERNETYRENPVNIIIDRNVENAKSKINEMHRRAIDGIDNKTREYTGVNTQDRNLRREGRESGSGRWWWPFPE